MKPLSDFRRKVRQAVRECPTAIIDEAIRDAAIEFADYTYCWHEVLPSIRVRDGVQDYEFSAPSQGRLCHVLYVSHSDVRVLPTTERTLDTTQSGWRTSEAATAQWYYMPDRTHIRLALTPSETESRALSITAAFKPIVDATELDNIFYDDHLEAITHGALMRLYGQETEKWGSLDASNVRRQLFEIAKRKEKAEQLNNHTRESTLTVRPHAYW